MKIRTVRAWAVATTAIAACVCGVAQPQGSPQPKMMDSKADPGWEVVSVRAADPNAKDDKFDVMGRHVIVQNQTVEIMLMMSYGLQKSQLANIPAWAKTQRFDVDGVASVDGQPDVQQFQSMVRKLLSERFGLKMHMEQREMPVFALTVTKDGPKLAPSKGDPGGLPREQVNGGSGVRRLAFTNTSMKEMGLLMLLEVDRPIVDRTGLSGKYDFKLSFTNDESRAPTDGSAPPSLFTAVQEQLGLKLEAVKGPAPVLVVDAVERPSAN